MSGAAHFRVITIASADGILFGFDTAHRRHHALAARFFFALAGRSRRALEVRAVGFSASTMALQPVAALFLMPDTRGPAVERMKGFPRYGAAKSLAPQYVIPRRVDPSGPGD